MANTQLTQSGAQVQADLDLLDNNNATQGQVLTADGNGGASWQPVIPTVVIALSQIVSQDPLEVQLTDAQYNIFANNKQVILDLSALEQPTVVWHLQIYGSSTMYFGFVSAHSDTTLDSNLIYIDKSTKVATYYNNTIAGGGMTNPMTTAGDIIVGGASGSPTRLGLGTAGQVLKVNAAGTGLEYGAGGGNSWYPYLYRSLTLEFTSRDAGDEECYYNVLDNFQGTFENGYMSPDSYGAKLTKTLYNVDKILIMPRNVDAVQKNFGIVCNFDALFLESEGYQSSNVYSTVVVANTIYKQYQVESNIVIIPIGSTNGVTPKISVDANLQAN